MNNEFLLARKIQRLLEALGDTAAFSREARQARLITKMQQLEYFGEPDAADVINGARNRFRKTRAVRPDHFDT